MTAEATSPDDVKSASPAQALIDQVDKSQPPEADKTPDPKVEGKEKTAGVEPAAAPIEGEQGDEGKSKNKVSFKERIDQLTAKNHELRRRAEAAEDNLRKLQQGLKPPPPTASEEEHEEFRLRKVVRSERVDEATREAQVAASEAQRAVFDTFQAKADAASDRFPGLVDKFLALPVVSTEIADFIADSDFGAELAHHLVENPGEADRISRLSPFEQGRALARIEATMAKPAKRPSNAPQPPPPNPGNPGASAKGPEDMSVDDMSKWYAGLRKRG